MLGIHALNASLSLLLEYGMEQVESRLLENSRFLQRAISQREQYELLSPRTEGRFAGITTFRHRTRASEQLYNYLTRGGVVCARRGGGVRLSPHFYTDKATLQKLAMMIGDFSGR